MIVKANARFQTETGTKELLPCFVAGQITKEESLALLRAKKWQQYRYSETGLSLLPLTVLNYRRL